MKSSVACLEAKIHPTAIVYDGATIASGVEIGPYSVIGANVSLGAGTVVGPHVVIDGHTTLGENCRVFQFASIGSPPQDLKWRGEPSTLIIGSGNVIREYVTLQPGTETGHMTTRIGDNNLFMASSHVAHDCVVGSSNVFANSVALAGHVEVGSFVIIGGMVGIHQFTRIGDFAFLSGGSMIGKDIPHYCIGQGDRCRLRGINVIGLQRAGYSEAEVRMVRRVYRQLFGSIGSVERKLESLAPEVLEAPLVKNMVDFIRSSKRGIANPHIRHGDESDD